DEPAQGGHEPLVLVAQPAFGQRGQRLGIVAAADERLEHRPAGHAQDVGGDGTKLDVRPLERLVEPLGLAAALLDQPSPVADELAQLALAAVRDVAAAEQAVAQQIGDPLGVLHVGLAAGDRLETAAGAATWIWTTLACVLPGLRERQSVVPQVAGDQTNSRARGTSAYRPRSTRRSHFHPPWRPRPWVTNSC